MTVLVERDRRHAPPAGQHRGTHQRRPQRTDDRHVDPGRPRVGRHGRHQSRRDTVRRRHVCDGIDLSDGSNVLLLSWSTETGNGGTVETNVSYHFAVADDGRATSSRASCARRRADVDVQLVRRAARAARATRRRSVRARASPTAPPAEPPVDPVPCTRPDWVIIVSEPLAADAIRRRVPPTPSTNPSARTPTG